MEGLIGKASKGEDVVSYFEPLVTQHMEAYDPCKIQVLTRIFHAPDALICKAFRGAAVVFYCKPLITQQMNESGSAQRVKFIQLKRKKPWVQSVTGSLLLLFNLTQ